MNKFKVSAHYYYELSVAEKSEASNKGRGGKEYANYLRVDYNGKTIALKSDGMEPEDARFTRDLSWVAVLIQKAYDIGYAEGVVGGEENYIKTNFRE